MTENLVVCVILPFVLCARFGFRISDFGFGRKRLRLVNAYLPSANRPACRRGRGQVVGLFEPRRRAFDAMNFREAVKPPPEVAVLDRRHAAVPLPLPVVLFPVGQTRFQAAT